MTNKEIKVAVLYGEAFIIEGHEHCYKTEEAAWGMSKHITSRPAIMGLIYNKRRLFLAKGDSYINCEGEGRYLYGKRGAMVSLVVAQPE